MECYFKTAVFFDWYYMNYDYFEAKPDALLRLNSSNESVWVWVTFFIVLTRILIHIPVQNLWFWETGESYAPAQINRSSTVIINVSTVNVSAQLIITKLAVSSPVLGRELI